MNTFDSQSAHALLLQNVGRFIELDETQQNLYLSLFKEKRIRRKDFLLQPGEITRYEYFVVQGALKVYTLDLHGKPHVSMFAIEDYWTGDMASFLTQQPSSYFIEALEDTEVLMISKENWDRLFQIIPAFEQFYRNLYQRSLVSYIQRTNQGISLSAEERYHIFLKKYPFLINRISQKDLAAYLGVTPEYVSMLRNKLSKK
ncbi:MAG: Crp/Fnr family transcriptional regulator [Rhodothermaceae bacterium]|nr:Crp/Fnr family transcriptional regulator [Rhodothermaceae bacterium]